MIEVRGTKTEQRDNDPAQRYALKQAAERSKTPMFVGLLLAAVGLYLKSIFPSTGSVGDKAAPAGPPEEEPLQEAVEALPSRSQGDAETTDTQDERVGSSSSYQFFDLQASKSFSIIESPSFEFSQPATRSEWPGFKAPPVLPFAANDNIGTGQIGDGGSEGGSGMEGEPPGPPAGDEDDVDGTDENRAPRVNGPVYLMDVVACATLAIALADLLQHTEDPDGDNLTIRNLTSSTGTLKSTEGGWVFEAGPNEYGPVMLTYQVSDGEFVVDQVAYFSIVPTPPVIGTAGDDILLGSMCADEINGAGGHDIIDARAGSDIVIGAAGNDHVMAGEGDDEIFGGDGNDVIFAGDGNDHVSGGRGNDRLFGEGGDDILFGDEHDDHVSGGAGSDLLFGGMGDDRLEGDDGDDRLDGGEGDDVLYGGRGDDTIDAGKGDDTIDGGEGDDVIRDGHGRDDVWAGSGDDHVIATLDSTDDHYRGGEGCDVLDYSESPDSLLIDLVAGQASGAAIGEDCISGFEVIFGGYANDVFVIGGESVVITGGEGGDVFRFNASEPSEATAVSFEVTDFQAGDRIRTSKYELFDEIFKELEDQFEKIYGESLDQDNVRIRYRDDKSEEGRRKTIEADFDRDGIWEATIEVNERHLVATVEAI